MDRQWLRDCHLLLWVRTGTARVDTTNGRSHQVLAGTGIWIPATAGGTVTTAAGSVAFPYLVSPAAAPHAPSTPLQFSVPTHWQEWLILHFIHGSTGHGIFGYSPAALAELLRHSAPADSAAWPLGEAPPLPVPGPACSVAHELRRNPSIDHSLEDWARLTAASASTLRRGFITTGLTFSRWRTLTRLAAGCGFLIGGFTVTEAALRSGFGSRNGFTRAFRASYGIAPHDVLGRSALLSPGFAPRLKAAAGTAALAALLQQSEGIESPETPELTLPATRTSWHVNDVHVLVWMFRGTGDLQLGDLDLPLRTGDAVWIPAGTEHQVGNDSGSVSLPVCTLLPDEAQVTEALRVHFPPAWNDHLLHRAVATRSALRPADFDPRDILHLFDAQLSAQRLSAVPLPTDAAAREYADSFLVAMRRPASSHLGAAARRAFRRETGMSLARWELTARMRVAGDLLDSGVRPTAVAARVGYATLRSFSRAFRAFFGAAPRDYRSRDRDH